MDSVAPNVPWLARRTASIWVVAVLFRDRLLRNPFGVTQFPTRGIFQQGAGGVSASSGLHIGHAPAFWLGCSRVNPLSVTTLHRHRPPSRPPDNNAVASGKSCTAPRTHGLERRGEIAHHSRTVSVCVQERVKTRNRLLTAHHAPSSAEARGQVPVRPSRSAPAPQHGSGPSGPRCPVSRP